MSEHEVMMTEAQRLAVIKTLTSCSRGCSQIIRMFDGMVASYYEVLHEDENSEVTEVRIGLDGNFSYIQFGKLTRYEIDDWMIKRFEARMADLNEVLQEVSNTDTEKVLKEDTV